MKKWIAMFLCVAMLMCGTACGKQDLDDIETAVTLKNGEITEQSVNTTLMAETAVTNTTIFFSQETANTTDETESTGTTVTTTVHDNTTDNSQETTNLIEQTTPVFNTENIVRVTLYAYYGQGKGSDVPGEYMTEIVNWLGTFSIDKPVTEPIPPGTNTYHAEIEYSDGTVAKQGLNVILVNGDAYYIKGAGAPACFMDIIAKTSITY